MAYSNLRASRSPQRACRGRHRCKNSQCRLPSSTHPRFSSFPCSSQNGRKLDEVEVYNMDEIGTGFTGFTGTCRWFASLWSWRNKEFAAEFVAGFAKNFGCGYGDSVAVARMCAALPSLYCVSRPPLGKSGAARISATEDRLQVHKLW